MTTPGAIAAPPVAPTTQSNSSRSTYFLPLRVRPPCLPSREPVTCYAAVVGCACAPNAAQHALADFRLYVAGSPASPGPNNPGTCLGTVWLLNPTATLVAAAASWQQGAGTTKAATLQALGSVLRALHQRLWEGTTSQQEVANGAKLYVRIEELFHIPTNDAAHLRRLLTGAPEGSWAEPCPPPRPQRRPQLSVPQLPGQFLLLAWGQDEPHLRTYAANTGPDGACPTELLVNSTPPPPGTEAAYQAVFDAARQRAEVSQLPIISVHNAVNGLDLGLDYAESRVVRLSLPNGRLPAGQPRLIQAKEVVYDATIVHAFNYSVFDGGLVEALQAAIP